MDVLEALGGWRNINQEKLDQIKVDNPPLYNAITKAINLLAKKYGGEDIVIEKPIEVVAEVVSPSEDEISDYKIVKKIEVLSLSKGDWPTRQEIVDSFIDEMGYDKDELIAIGIAEQDIYKKLDDLNARDLVLRVGDEYQVSGNGQALIDKYELQNKQVEELTPSDEDLKLEILMRMADYYNGVEYQLLTQDDIITNGTKHQFDIPSNKYFGLVVKLLGDGFVEKDPSGLTDSIRLTSNGYDKALGWFEENLPEEATSTTPPSTQLTDLQISILEAVKEASATKIGDGFVSTTEIWPYNKGMMPINYDVFTQNSTTPSLEKDLALLAFNGYLEFASAGTKPSDFRYRLSKKGEDLVSATNTLIDLKDFVEAQPTPTPAQPAPTQTNLRPSPTKSATLFSTGTKMFGNDGNVWMVVETKNGVKRWNKFGEIPSDLPVETPISEIEEDEVDLDILEQQLNDDSLEFDITDEDLENLEF